MPRRKRCWILIQQRFLFAVSEIHLPVLRICPTPCLCVFLRLFSFSFAHFPLDRVGWFCRSWGFRRRTDARATLVAGGSRPLHSSFTARRTGIQIGRFHSSELHDRARNRMNSALRGMNAALNSAIELTRGREQLRAFFVARA